MKLLATLIILILLASSLHAEPTQEETLTTDKQKQGYALGVDIGKNLKRLSPFIDLQKFLLGISHSFQDIPLLISTSDQSKYKQQIYQQAQLQKLKEDKVLAQKNLSMSMAFLEENKKRQNVVTLQSGLQYLIERRGEGETPSNVDYVEVHYKGTLFNGTEFENTYSTNTPQVINLEKSILGWQQAFPLMPVGSQFKLFVPSYLAYGPKGSGTKIQPNMALIFDIELLAIKGSQKKSAPKSQQPIKPSSQELPQFLQENPPNAIINLRGISLDTLEKAAWSVLKLRNDIMPPYQTRHIQAVCDAISTDMFMNECLSLMDARVKEIRSMRAMKARFNNQKLTALDTETMNVSLEWDENYTIDSAPDLSYHRTLDLSFQNINKEYRLNSFSLK